MSNELIVEKDLRSIMPFIRDQGKRPLCLAFAASDFNSAHNQLKNALSVEYLAHYAYLKEGHKNYQKGLTTKSVIEVLHELGQPNEELMPYSLNAKSPLVPESSIAPKFYVSSIESNDVKASIDGHLNKETVFVACISLPPSFLTITPPYILDDESGHIGNHAILIVGVARKLCGGKYFLARNSWGIGWGDNGYCWLSEDFLNKRTIALLEVESSNESYKY